MPPLSKRKRPVHETFSRPKRFVANYIHKEIMINAAIETFTGAGVTLEMPMFACSCATCCQSTCSTTIFVHCNQCCRKVNKGHCSKCMHARATLSGDSKKSIIVVFTLAFLGHFSQSSGGHPNPASN
ncbi:unnamed protein product [Ixodes pacificus]